MEKKCKKCEICGEEKLITVTECSDCYTKGWKYEFERRLNQIKKEELTQEEIKEIEEARKGEFVSEEEAKERLGV